MEMLPRSYDYNSPETEMWAQRISDAAYDMNQDMPNHRQLALIPSNACQAACGILNTFLNYSRLGVLSANGTVHMSFFNDGFNLEDALYEGMHSENQGWLCEDWPEFTGYVIDRITGNMGDEPIFFWD